MDKNAIKKAMSIIIRALAYLILFGIIRGLLTFGDGTFGAIVGWIIGLIVTAFVISILEVRGITKRLLDKLFKITVDSNVILPTYTVECPNCGNEFTINGSTGTCPCCATKVNHR